VAIPAGSDPSELEKVATEHFMSLGFKIASFVAAPIKTAELLFPDESELSGFPSDSGSPEFPAGIADV